MSSSSTIPVPGPQPFWLAGQLVRGDEHYDVCGPDGQVVAEVSIPDHTQIDEAVAALDCGSRPC